MNVSSRALICASIATSCDWGTAVLCNLFRLSSFNYVLLQRALGSSSLCRETYLFLTSALCKLRDRVLIKLHRNNITGCALNFLIYWLCFLLIKITITKSIWLDLRLVQWHHLWCDAHLKFNCALSFFSHKVIGLTFFVRQDNQCAHSVCASVRGSNDTVWEMENTHLLNDAYFLVQENSTRSHARRIFQP